MTSRSRIHRSTAAGGTLSTSRAVRATLRRMRLRSAVPLILLPLLLGAAPSGTVPTRADLIQPEALAKELALPEAERPALVHVGFQVLYRNGHIAGSKYAGPCSTPRGRAELKKALSTMPKDREIVLYCGCCPWVHCPNVKPAFRVARSLGFKNARILYVVADMQRDWVDKGLPALVP